MSESLDGKTVVGALTENVLKTRFEDIDPTTVDNMKKVINLAVKREK